MGELTDKQLERQDFVDNSIFELVQLLNPKAQQIIWDIEMIGQVRDAIETWLVVHLRSTDRMSFYPYVQE